MSSTPTPRFSLDTITKTLGLIAGIAALIWIFGGAVLAWRLRTNHLPADTVVAGIPREFLISIGLFVVLQAVVYVGAVALALLGDEWLVPAAALGTLVLLYPSWRFIRRDDWRWGWLLLALFLTFALLLVALGLYRRPHEQYRRPRAWEYLAVGFVLISAFVGWRAFFEYKTAQGLSTLLCLHSKGELIGLYIGESDKTIYIGEQKQVNSVVSSEQRIAEVPRASIDGIFIGPDAFGARCDLLRP